MCGIAGVLNLRDAPPPDLGTARAMLETIRHRGPDGMGVYRAPQVVMGNVRLSIIDLSGGDQPIGNEDGTLWIVYNGEVFNYVELRRGLEERGHRFKTSTDTEVILHLYEEKGPAALEDLNGQFALAIWDEKDQSLFLARDRIGIRPLFYTQANGRLIFGSEVKAIFAHPDACAEVDEQSLRELFTFWSPAPPRSIFKGVRELPPGHWMMARGGEIRVERWWAIEFHEEAPARGEDEYLDELESLLADATRLRLRADVPVGAYLSGGLDSSMISALILGLHPGRLETFSIAFSDPAFDESSHQAGMADFLGTHHNVVFCTHQDIGANLPEVIWHTEAPVLRTAPVPMFLLSGLVRDQGFKVVMTGEGADEFLAGYDIFKEMKIRRFWAKRPDSNQRPKIFAQIYPDIVGAGKAANRSFLFAFFKKSLLDTASPYYSHQIRWSNTARCLKFLRGAESWTAPEPALPEGFDGWSALGKAQFIEISTFLSPYLLSSQGDRMAMGHSVEGRYPFLDYRVMEFCARLPDEMRMPVLHEKWLLRQMGKKHLPEAIWQRRKRPYRAPIHKSFFAGAPGGGLDYVEDLLSEPAVTRAGYFEPGAVTRLAAKARGAAEHGGTLSEVEDMALVGILSTQVLHQQFIEGRKPASGTDASPLILVDHGLNRPVETRFNNKAG